jgi:DnaB-like helicase C terminal domain
MYPALARRGAEVCRGQLCLIVGPPSAGKSLLINNLVVRLNAPSLVFMLDTEQLTAAARFGAILSGDHFHQVKSNIDDYADRLANLKDLQAVFRADDMDDIHRQVAAFDQRYGMPPSLIAVDNLGNMTSAMDNEWALLKALTLELDIVAREQQCAVIAAAHTTDLTSCDPAARDKILGKISYYPRLILSVGLNADTGEYRIAIVKNSSGKTDARAEHPVLMYADPSRMQLTEDNPRWTPSGITISAGPVAGDWGTLV